MEFTTITTAEYCNLNQFTHSHTTTKKGTCLKIPLKLSEILSLNASAFLNGWKLTLKEWRAPGVQPRSHCWSVTVLQTSQNLRTLTCVPLGGRCWFQPAAVQQISKGLT